MSDSILRRELKDLLTGGNAHFRIEDVINSFSVDYINSKAQNIPYSAWELLEHMRITQRDIIDFITTNDYKELNWPEGYWPKKNKSASIEEWSETSKMFLNDLQVLLNMVEDANIDMFLTLPYGDEYTIFREILLVADHNSYHLGQLMSLKRALQLS